jgi:hypothetical protein
MHIPIFLLATPQNTVDFFFRHSGIPHSLGGTGQAFRQTYLYALGFAYFYPLQAYYIMPCGEKQ